MKKMTVLKPAIAGCNEAHFLERKNRYIYGLVKFLHFRFWKFPITLFYV